MCAVILIGLVYFGVLFLRGLVERKHSTWFYFLLCFLDTGATVNEYSGLLLEALTTEYSLTVVHHGFNWHHTVAPLHTSYVHPPPTRAIRTDTIDNSCQQPKHTANDV